jgi:hypothetical protein
MMTERSGTWFDTSREVIYYGGSIHFNNNYVWYRYGGIKTAHLQRLPDGPEVKLTHRVYNVNAQITFVPKLELSPKPIRDTDRAPWPASPKIAFGIEDSQP